MKVSIATILLLAFTANAQVFDVTKYGAKANSDISQALTSAWKEACASTSSSQVVIPKETYNLGTVTLQGPCKGPIEIKQQGTLLASGDLKQFKDAWVIFLHVDRLTLSGGGTFDGQGKNAWTHNDCQQNSACKTLPISLRFDFVTNSIVQDITSLDSKYFHINVLGGKNLTFQHLTITAPADSPNTDGIHIGRSSGIKIIDTTIGTGDDCISLGDGSQDITVTGVSCGPGHGISVGSLGKYEDEEPVSGIHVTKCTISNTQNGVRIKTWPASSGGTASDMHFEDITMKNVQNPILIDQAYCPLRNCKAQVPSKVKISNVSFKNIKGTSATQESVKLVCSSGVPCEQVELADIDLPFSGGAATSICTNINPKISGKQNPPLCAD